MNIYDRVDRSIREESRINDKEFFTSRQYSEYVWQKGVNIITGTFHNLRKMGYDVSRNSETKLADSLDVRVIFDPGNEVTAYTGMGEFGGRAVTINRASTMVAVQPTREKKHMAILGLLFHEIAHVLFTDFHLMHRHMESLKAGCWYPQAPQRAHMIPAEVFGDSEYLGLLCRCACEIDNSIEDGFIEAMITEIYPGRGRKALDFINRTLVRRMVSFEEGRRRGERTVALLMTQILIYSKLGTINTGNAEERIRNTISQITDVLDRFGKDPEPVNRKRAVNEILCLLFPYIDDEYEQLRDRLRDEAQKKELRMNEKERIALESLLTKGRIEMGIAPRNEEGISEPVARLKKIHGRADNGKVDRGSINIGYPELSFIEKEAEIDLEMRAAEEGLLEKLKEDSRIDFRLFGFDGDRTIDIRRKIQPGIREENAYEKISDSVEETARILSEGIRRVKLEKKKEGKQRGLYFGRRIEASAFYREDGRIFSRNSVPGEDPLLAVGVLCDQSGSTRGDLIDRTRTTALVMEAFCRRMDIPLVINGYTTGEKGPMILSYCEEGSRDGKDRYRIMDMRDMIGTPTVAALAYFARKMAGMPHKSKVLFVISDGCSGDNDILPDGTTRIEKICDWASENGILLIAAGIGADREAVKKEFKGRFLDISDISKMPEELVNILLDMM